MGASASAHEPVKTLLDPSNYRSEVEFTINGKKYTAGNEIPGDTSLNTFIREHAHLKGTKFMCLEGGCGACIVSVRSHHPKTQKEVSYSVNSCLVSVFMCHGWAITTIEGLGSKATGYHDIQKRLAAANGTQCGFCSPAMVMNMHSLLEANPKMTMKEIENSFGGNICRCTGYRPILDAMKTFASDAPPELVKKIADIEDMVCPKSGQICKGMCGESCDPVIPDCDPNTTVHLTFKEGPVWYRPTSVKEVFEIFDMIADKSYRLVAGNTAQGVYHITSEPDVLIDINGVAELYGSEVTGQGVQLGANINLTEAMNLFYQLAQEQPNQYSYLKTLGDHIDLIAHVPVRNVGTFAGNLDTKHVYEEFPSDIFLMLEMVGATLTIRDLTGVEKTVSLLEYLQMNTKKTLLTKINLPMLDNNHFITKSYKIMPRTQNAHAYVNAGFKVKVNKSGKYKVLETPTIVFGGIHPKFVHAQKTEAFLNGKELLDDATLTGALKVLASEINPDVAPPDATPEYRKGLAESLFYKFILSLKPDAIKPEYVSGGTTLQRPVTSGKQEFDTDRNIWPLNKPIPKVEALIQCSGEAEYSNDIPAFPGQLWGQLVHTERALAVIEKIDPTEALKMPGVVAFYSAKDIPGKNSFTQPIFTVVEDEPIFVKEGNKADYAGQAVGVILAETNLQAIRAAQKVKITYGKHDKPVMDIREVLNNKMMDRVKEYGKITPTAEKKNIKYKVKGTWDLKSQYHYTMEPHTSVALPVEDQLQVYPASQWPSSAQEVISLALNMPENHINIRVRRVGGGYGAKLSRSNHVAVVSALAAHLSRRPVRVVYTIESCMKWAGKRFPVYYNYEAGVDEKGEIQFLNCELYQDDGHCPNDSSVTVTLHHIKSCYDPSTWNIKGYGVKTDGPSNSWCRAPGSTEGISLIETVMEHIGKVIGKDPNEVRLANIDPNDDSIPKMIKDIKESSDYDKRVRDIEEFNKKNRWRKRGISMVPMNYPFSFWGNFYATVAVFQQDGTVAITHGGIEMGQGLNTKAAQVAAHVLGIDLELVSVKPTYVNLAPNNVGTGGSLGSEAVAYAIKQCCEDLNKKLEPVKAKLGENATWPDVIKAAYAQDVDLCSKYMFTNKDEVKAYNIYGIGVTEVEVDCLTGNYQTLRADILEDAGQSLSPEIDIGQVEGAFIMGLGYFTCEQIVYNPETGQNLTHRTWTYKPPGAKDIPIDFRVTLRKNADNPLGVLRSKATGEPPFCLSCSVTFAIRNALESARKDAGETNVPWFDIQPPFTTETIWLGTLNKIEDFKLH